jgi:hypothetical protein
VTCCTNCLSVTGTKYLRSTIYKEETFILVHAFRGFGPRPAGSLLLDLWQSRAYGGAKLLSSWDPGSKEREKQIHHSRGHSMAYLSQQEPPPKVSTPPIAHSVMNPSMDSSTHEVRVLMTPPLNTAALGTKPSTHKLSGT